MNIDKEIEFLEDQYARGEITLEELKKEERDIWRSYQANAEEAAQAAYDDEMGRW